MNEIRPALQVKLKGRRGVLACAFSNGQIAVEDFGQSGPIACINLYRRNASILLKQTMVSLS
jgi:hypothetical protein